MGSTANEIMMFIDTSKCIGCRACQVACKQWHSLPAETDSGQATSGPSTTTLTDSTKSWAINEWAGRGVQILTGVEADEKRTISSNTATVLTVSPAWGTGPSTNDYYAISTTFNGEYTNPPDMSGSTLTVVRFNESSGTPGFSPYFTEAHGFEPDDGVVDGVQFLFFKDQCRHCYQPKCKRGCPDGVYTTKEGFVLFGQNCNDEHLKPRKKKNPDYDPITDRRKLINMTFAEHCPYDIPRLSTSLNQYVKCDFCYDRFASIDTDLQRNKTSLGISSPYTTACEYACPTGAIVTGSYAQIYDLARSYSKERYRAVRRTHPRANIYHGLWGRIHVLWLLTDTPDKYGLETAPDDKLGFPDW